jgi:uncharacterized protein (TIGR02996 family)
MSDEDALLAAVRDDPRAETPRLVYADWLDDHGRPDEARAHRAACEADLRGVPAEATSARGERREVAHVVGADLRVACAMPLGLEVRGLCGVTTNGLAVCAGRAVVVRTDDGAGRAELASVGPVHISLGDA